MEEFKPTYNFVRGAERLSLFLKLGVFSGVEVYYDNNGCADMDDADLSRRLLKDCVHGDFLAPCNHQKCVGGTFIAQKLWSKVHVLSTNGLFDKSGSGVSTDYTFNYAGLRDFLFYRYSRRLPKLEAIPTASITSSSGISNSESDSKSAVGFCNSCAGAPEVAYIHHTHIRRGETLIT